MLLFQAVSGDKTPDYKQGPVEGLLKEVGYSGMYMTGHSCEVEYSDYSCTHHRSVFAFREHGVQVLTASSKQFTILDFSCVFFTLIFYIYSCNTSIQYYLGSFEIEISVVDYATSRCFLILCHHCGVSIFLPLSAPYFFLVADFEKSSQFCAVSVCC